MSESSAQLSLFIGPPKNESKCAGKQGAVGWLRSQRSQRWGLWSGLTATQALFLGFLSPPSQPISFHFFLSFDFNFFCLLESRDTIRRSPKETEIIYLNFRSVCFLATSFINWIICVQRPGSGSRSDLFARNISEARAQLRVWDAKPLTRSLGIPRWGTGSVGQKPNYVIGHAPAETI